MNVFTLHILLFCFSPSSFFCASYTKIYAFFCKRVSKYIIFYLQKRNLLLLNQQQLRCDQLRNDIKQLLAGQKLVFTDQLRHKFHCGHKGIV